MAIIQYNYVYVQYNFCFITYGVLFSSYRMCYKDLYYMSSRVQDICAWHNLHATWWWFGFFYWDPQLLCPLCDGEGYGTFMNKDLFPELAFGPATPWILCNPPLHCWRTFIFNLIIIMILFMTCHNLCVYTLYNYCCVYTLREFNTIQEVKYCCKNEVYFKSLINGGGWAFSQSAKNDIWCYLKQWINYMWVLVK